MRCHGLSDRKDHQLKKQRIVTKASIKELVEVRCCPYLLKLVALISLGISEAILPMNFHRRKSSNGVVVQMRIRFVVCEDRRFT